MALLVEKSSVDSMMSSDSRGTTSYSASTLAVSEVTKSSHGNDSTVPLTPVTDVALEKNLESDPQDGFITGYRLYAIVLGLCLSVILTGLDVTLLAIAIPTIVDQFNSLQDIGWYSGVFFIAICAFQPLGGKLFQFFSSKYVYISFVAVFEAGSLIAALAPSSAVLIVGRAVSGMGASGLFSGALLLVSTLAPPHQVPVLRGIVTATFGLASIVGPVLGGAFTEHLTWRWCFFINLPFGAVTCLIFLIFFPRAAEKNKNSSQSLLEKLRLLDIFGFVLFAAATVLLLFALQWGGVKYAWSSPLIIGFLCAAVVLAGLFLVWEWYKGDEASVPLSMLGNRDVALSCVVVLLANGGFQTIVYYFALWFQVVKNASPTHAGIMYLPTVVSDVLSAIVGGLLIAKFGYFNPFLLFALAVLAVGAGLDTLLRPATAASFWFGAQILSGVGNGLLVQTPFAAVQGALAPRHVPAGLGLVVYCQFLSCSLMQAVAQNIFVSRLALRLHDILPDDPQRVAALLMADVTAIRSKIPPQVLPDAIEAFNGAIVSVFYISVVGSSLAFLAALGMRWRKPQLPMA